MTSCVSGCLCPLSSTKPGVGMVLFSQAQPQLEHVPSHNRKPPSLPTWSGVLVASLVGRDRWPGLEPPGKAFIPIPSLPGAGSRYLPGSNCHKHGQCPREPKGQARRAWQPPYSTVEWRPWGLRAQSLCLIETWHQMGGHQRRELRRGLVPGAHTLPGWEPIWLSSLSGRKAAAQDSPTPLAPSSPQGPSS